MTAAKPTTNAGIPVSGDARSLTAGPNGPILLQDHQETGDEISDNVRK